jgi:hypothetical protein
VYLPSHHVFLVDHVLVRLAEGYNTLRRRFGPDSFWVNGPYHAIMSALTPSDYDGSSPFANILDQLGIDTGNVPPAAPGATPRTLMLRQATASPFDNLLDVMSAGGSPGRQGQTIAGPGVVAAGPVVPDLMGPPRMPGAPYYHPMGQCLSLCYGEISMLRVSFGSYL